MKYLGIYKSEVLFILTTHSIGYSQEYTIIFLIEYKQLFIESIDYISRSTS
jgi:hypothetical protein